MPPKSTAKTTNQNKEKRAKHKTILKEMGDGVVGLEIAYLMNSRYKLLYITTNEERRVTDCFKLVSAAENYKLFQWDMSRGMIDTDNNKQVNAANNEIHQVAQAAVGWVVEQAREDNKVLQEDKGRSVNGYIYLFYDLHHYLHDRGVPQIERMLKEFASIPSACSIVIISHAFICPPGLRSEMQVLDFPYPSKNELRRSLKTIVNDIPIQYPAALKSAQQREEDLLNAVSGLTLTEAENAFAKTLVKHKDFNISTILGEKKQLIRKNGILEYRDPRFSFDNIGGLEALKMWLQIRKQGFSDDAVKFGLEVPKGLLLVGVPGCVVGDTKIRVKKTSNKGQNKEQETTIEDFFALCETGDTYQIETPDGWQSVGSLVKKRDKKCYNLVLESGVELGCSDDHYVLTSKGWMNACELDFETSVITKTGSEKLVAKEYIGIRDTFDLEVKTIEHRYYSNGIVSHNTGKSMSCDALASYYEMPLLRLDMGAIFTSLVGESEQNMRNIIKITEAVAPAVLWVDEIEKGIGGVKSSNMTDSGVTNRVFGTLLTWMQDKTAPVFVVCTANSVADIPPEFMRAGRLDEIFFVDLPNAEQRAEVAACLLSRKQRDPDEFELNKIAAVSENYSPAELEKGINNALFTAFSDGHRCLTTEDIVTELDKFQPLYNSRREEIESMREWALGVDGTGGRAVLANARVIESVTKDFSVSKNVGSLNFDITEEDL